MALTNVNVRVEYNGTGAQTTFAIPFALIEDVGSSSAEVKVYVRDTSTDPVTETLKTITTHYTLTGGPPPTNVVFVTAPASGTKNVVLIRQLALTHDLNLSENAEFPVEDVEDKIDRAFALLQQMQEQLDRTIKWDITSDTSGISAEDPTAERYFRMSSDNTRIEFVIGSGEINPPATSTDNAVVRWDGTGGTAVQNSGVTIDDSDNMDIPGNLVVDGNLTVSGTTTTINTATIDIEDPNINLNNGGNQAAANNIAGLNVEMSDATHASLLYSSTSATKWKAGEVGSEVDLVGISSTQTLTNKTLTSPVINTSVSGTAVLDEDNMASDSATQLATQQSIKAYSDSATQTMTNKTLTSPTLTSPVLNTGVSGTAVLDEDNMASNSATHLATQQSIKAYVDTIFTTGLNLPSEVFTSTDTLDANNALALCNTSGGAFTLNLPAATGSNKRYWIKYTDSGFANALTVDPNGTDTIGGGGAGVATTLNTEGETIEIVDAASGAWTILRRDIPSKIVEYTPTFTGFGSIANVEFFWMRNGVSLSIIGRAQCGTPTATEAQITLPSGLTIGTITTIKSIGTMQRAGADNIYSVLITNADTFLNFAGGSGRLSPSNGDALFTAGQIFSVEATTIPISGWNS
jgi:hypothetical protein